MKKPPRFRGGGGEQIKCNVLRLAHTGIDEKQQKRQQANLICKTNTDRRQDQDQNWHIHPLTQHYIGPLYCQAQNPWKSAGTKKQS